MSTQETYLRAILATVARTAFPPDLLLEIVATGSDKIKQVKVYNLCDGSRSQGEIVKEAGLDKGNFSRTLSRWEDEGIVIRVGTGRDVRPLHVYPLPANALKKGTGKNAK